MWPCSSGPTTSSGRRWGFSEPSWGSDNPPDALHEPPVLLPSTSLLLHSSPSPDIPGLRRELEERRADPKARSPLTNRRLEGLGKRVKVAGSFPNGGDAAEQGCRTSIPLGPSPGSETGPEWREIPYFSRDSLFLTCMKIQRIP